MAYIRDDVAGGSVDSELTAAGLGIVMLELIANSFDIGMDYSGAVGGIVFLVGYLGLMYSSTAAVMILSALLTRTMMFLYQEFFHKNDFWTMVVYMLIAFVILGFKHVDAYRYLHPESDERYYDDIDFVDETTPQSDR